MSALSLSACYQKIDPAKLSSYTDTQLCFGAAASVNGDAPLKELVRRGVLNESDLPLIASHTIRQGMPECALIAMKGSPNDGLNHCGGVNTSGGAGGSRKQYVYRPCGKLGTTKYVYIQNGLISSWQNW